MMAINQSKSSGKNNTFEAVLAVVLHMVHICSGGPEGTSDKTSPPGVTSRGDPGGVSTPLSFLLCLLLPPAHGFLCQRMDKKLSSMNRPSHLNTLTPSQAFSPPFSIPDGFCLAGPRACARPSPDGTGTTAGQTPPSNGEPNPRDG